MSWLGDAWHVARGFEFVPEDEITTDDVARACSCRGCRRVRGGVDAVCERNRESA